MYRLWFYISYDVWLVGLLQCQLLDSMYRFISTKVLKREKF